MRVGLTEQIFRGYDIKKWWPELRLDLHLAGIAADYYLFYAMKDGDVYLQQKFEEYSGVLAKQIAIYFDAACGGELRHKSSDYLNTSDRSMARGEWRKRRKSQGLSVLKRGEKDFFHGSWKSGYGGPSWGKIANLLVKHLEGDISSHIFLDQAFAIQHNGGTVFNKIEDYWAIDALKMVLDYNLNENWAELIKYASPWARKLFQEWLTTEDQLNIEGVEYSNPTEHEIGPAIRRPRVGAQIKINDDARVKEWRGQTVKVIGYRYDYSKKFGKVVTLHCKKNDVEKWVRQTATTWNGKGVRTGIVLSKNIEYISGVVGEVK